ncbi:hypothetical protein AURDEDRAFT_178494 [Auricularia subglabra TFB-10046 SS5]|uniref:Uncharacterized protein n=1 Tax=Auricularia subglabra (strain TFB-10046 / SS5) TaxID=717982 RepID=J0WJK6_AURST|nr:hypothetical protein AURDEDRAFT_178494 [Auricularia subglabra TFB-10046 SS5]
MGQWSILDISSPPKAASSAAARAVSADPSHSPTPTPSPSPAAPAGEASSSVVSGLGPGAAVAAPVPPGGIVPSAFVALAGGFGPPSFLVATPTVSAPTVVAPARSPEGNGDDLAAVLAVPAADDNDVVGEESVPEASAAGGSPASVVEVAPPLSSLREPPLGTMSWAELQAEARARAVDLVGVENLGVSVWPPGEPSHLRIRRWERALGVAVDHFDNLLTSLPLPPRLRRLVTALRNRYGRQLALARDGCDALEALVILEPEAARTPPSGRTAPVSSAPAGRRVCEVVVPPAPSAWAGSRPHSPRPPVPPSSGPPRKRPRAANESAGAGPSSATKKRKKDLSPSPDLSPPPPPRPRKSSKGALVDKDGVPVKVRRIRSCFDSLFANSVLAVRPVR